VVSLAIVVEISKIRGSTRIISRKPAERYIEILHLNHGVIFSLSYPKDQYFLKIFYLKISQVVHFKIYIYMDVW